jgi:hypothetical protein
VHRLSGTRERGRPGPGDFRIQKSPLMIDPWYGPPRGFSFSREVQPGLDRYCVSCHDGRSEHVGALRSARRCPSNRLVLSHRGAPFGEPGRKFSVACGNLHQYVRRPGIESDIDLLSPME